MRVEGVTLVGAHRKLGLSNFQMNEASVRRLVHDTFTLTDKVWVIEQQKRPNGAAQVTKGRSKRDLMKQHKRPNRAVFARPRNHPVAVPMYA